MRPQIAGGVRTKLAEGYMFIPPEGQAIAMYADTQPGMVIQRCGPHIELVPPVGPYSCVHLSYCGASK